MAKKILVIDDDPVGSALVEARLKNEGYEVCRAMDGAQGLQAVQTLPVDLIILDVEMPQMNGYEFIVNLSQIEDVKGTPVIVLTAHEENKAIFSRRKIEHYLVKPVDFDLLFGKIKSLLGQA